MISPFLCDRSIPVQRTSLLSKPYQLHIMLQACNLPTTSPSSIPDFTFLPHPADFILPYISPHALTIPSRAQILAFPPFFSQSKQIYHATNPSNVVLNIQAMIPVSIKIYKPPFLSSDPSHHHPQLPSRQPIFHLTPAFSIHTTAFPFTYLRLLNPVQSFTHQM